MQDLLNEKEFLQKPYNPRKVFYAFYAIALIQLLLFITLFMIVDNKPRLATGFAAMLLPDITALFMYFFTKKNALLPFKTLVKATLVLFSIYYVPAIVTGLINNGYQSTLPFLAVISFNYLLCVVIIYSVHKHKRKNLSGK